MSRFHLTSNSDVHRQARETCDDAGLESDGSIEDDKLFLTTYEKRALDTRNFLRTSEDGFVAVTGTLVIDGCLGAKALHEVYDAYTDGGVESVRERGFGQYAVLIKKGDKITIFCDPNGVYQTYYTSDGSWFVSNSLHLCGQSLDERTVDRYALYRRIIESTELSRSTLFEGVSRLSGGEKLVVDVSADTISVEHVPRPEKTWSYTDASIEQVLDDYAARTATVFDEMSTAADGVGVQATGGIDSRTVLAGSLYAGDTPMILYGVGNSKITNTKEEDRKIAKQYAERYDLPFYEMDWRGEYPIDVTVWDTLFAKYGFRYRMAGATPSFFSEFESGFPGHPELLLNGYGFGIFSNVYYWEDESLVSLSFEDTVKDVFTGAKGFSEEAFPCKKEYLDRLVDTCREVVKDFDQSDEAAEPLDRDALTKIVQLLKGRPQSPYCNVVNEFTYHLSPFATYELGQPMIDVPAEYRVGEKLRVKLLRRLYPDLLEIPLYSGTRKQQILENDEMRPARSARLVSWCGSCLPEPVLKIARPLYKRATDSSYGDINDRIFEAHRNRISEDGLISDCFNLEEYDDHIRRHSRFALFEHGLNRMGYDDVRE